MNFATRTFGRRRGHLLRRDESAPRVRGIGRIEALCLPVRLALMEHIKRHGPATATEAGAAIGLTPAAASYHLRVLGEHGFLVECGGERDGRKRRWQLTSQQLTVDPTSAATPEEAHALDRLEAALFERASDVFTGYLQRRDEYPEQWRQAASSVQDTLVLTPAELNRLRADLVKLLARYRTKRSEPAGDATRVFVAVNAVPLDPPPGPQRRRRSAAHPPTPIHPREQGETT